MSVGSAFGFVGLGCGLAVVSLAVVLLWILAGSWPADVAVSASLVAPDLGSNRCRSGELPMFEGLFGLFYIVPPGID
jgi:hypothetical protein